MIVAIAVATVLGGTASVALATTAPVRAATTCTGTIQINSFAFTSFTQTGTVQNATFTLIAQNCTNQAQQTKVTWLGRFVGPGNTIPPGCPAFDPLVTAANFASLGQVTTGFNVSLFSGCTATDIQVTATISSAAGSTVFASATADLALHPTTGACTVSYLRQSEWGGGFVASVTVTNTGTSAISNWALSFLFPGDQRITNAWNAVVSQTGNAVSTHGNGMGTPTTLNAGAHVSFGFQGTWQTSDTSPNLFILNGVSCATA